jgi:uncharacterized RDD family membrane protein YckC
MSTPNPNPQNPYAPPTAAVADIVSGAGPGELAERASRLGAVIVDSIILLVAYLPSIIVAVRHFDPQRGLRNFLNEGMYFTGCLVLVWVVITCVLVARHGQTIGKRLIGIRVVRSNGEKASFWRIFLLRNVVNAIPGLIPIVSYIYGLVDALFIFGESRQCLHDKIADTIVVKA